MIPLENQVCSLDLAKQLKELGVEQESYFYHTQFENKEFHVNKYGGVLHDFRERWNRNARWVRIASAFTVAELGEMLSSGLDDGWKGVDGKWRCGWTYSPPKRGLPDVFEGYTEADARAKMLIYLLENKLITL